MIAFTRFQNSLNTRFAIFHIDHSQFQNTFKEKGSIIRINLLNFDQSFVLRCIFDIFPNEKPQEYIIELPKWIRVFLENKGKKTDNLISYISPLIALMTDESISFEIDVRIKDAFYKNEKIHEKSFFFSFLKLPELVIL